MLHFLIVASFVLCNNRVNFTEQNNLPAIRTNGNLSGDDGVTFSYSFMYLISTQFESTLNYII